MGRDERRLGQVSEQTNVSELKLIWAMVSGVDWQGAIS